MQGFILSYLQLKFEVVSLVNLSENENLVFAWNSLNIIWQTSAA